MRFLFKVYTLIVNSLEPTDDATLNTSEIGMPYFVILSVFESVFIYIYRIASSPITIFNNWSTNNNTLIWRKKMEPRFIIKYFVRSWKTTRNIFNTNVLVVSKHKF